jgi:Zn-finger nucleic acid-binding protein
MPYRTAPGGAALSCPRDRTPLLTESLGPILLAACGDCHGAWMAAAAFDQGVTYAAARPSELSEGPTGIFDASRPLACPECAAPLERRTLREFVTVDVCRVHGVWFDAGELRALAEGRRG